MVLAKTVLEIFSSVAVGCGIFDRLLNVDNCQPEAVSDVIPGVGDQMYLLANFDDSRLKMSKASFSAPFQM